MENKNLFQPWDLIRKQQPNPQYTKYQLREAILKNYARYSRAEIANYLKIKRELINDWIAGFQDIIYNYLNNNQLFTFDEILERFMAKKTYFIKNDDK